MFILEIDLDMVHITMLFPAFVPSCHLQSFLANTNKGDTDQDGNKRGAPTRMATRGTPTATLKALHITCVKLSVFNINMYLEIRIYIPTIVEPIISF